MPTVYDRPYRVFLPEGSSWRETGSNRSQPLDADDAALTLLTVIDAERTEPELPEGALRRMAPEALKRLEETRAGWSKTASEAAYFERFPQRRQLYERIAAVLKPEPAAAKGKR